MAAEKRDIKTKHCYYRETHVRAKDLILVPKHLK